MDESEYVFQPSNADSRPDEERTTGAAGLLQLPAVEVDKKADRTASESQNSLDCSNPRIIPSTSLKPSSLDQHLHVGVSNGSPYSTGPPDRTPLEGLGRYLEDGSGGLTQTSSSFFPH